MRFQQHICDLPIYETGKPIEHVMREYGIEADCIIKLGSNENPLGISPLAKQVILENAHLASTYPDDSYYDLRSSLSLKYGISESNIIVGNGSDEIIEFCMYAVATQDSKALMAQTTFAMYEIYAKRYRVQIIRTPDFFHNLESMLAFYKQHKPHIVFLCTPNNPLGEALPRDDVFKFLAQIDDDCLIVLDCAYMEYCAYKDSKYALVPKDILQFPNVIYLGTFSKAYGLAGMRVGYGIADNNIITLLQKIRSPFNITTLSLKAATTSLKDDFFLQQTLQLNAQEMVNYQNFAEQKGLKILESYTNFVTFLLHNNLNSTKIAILLLRNGIVVRDLAGYGLNAIRITIGTPEQNKIVLQRLSNLIVN